MMSSKPLMPVSIFLTGACDALPSYDTTFVKRGAATRVTAPAAGRRIAFERTTCGRCGRPGELAIARLVYAAVRVA